MTKGKTLSRLAKLRIILFAVIWAVAQAFVIWIYVKTPGGSNSPNLVPVVAMIGAPLGPFAGGVARFTQTDCVQASLTGFKYCWPFVILVGISLFATKSSRRIFRLVSLAAWGLGWFGWMAAALFTFGYAIS